MTWSNLILEDRSILHTMQNFGAAQWIAVLAGVLVLTSFVQGLFILRANGATRQVALAAQKAADFLKLVERPYVSEHIAESTGIQIQFRAGPDEGRDSPKPDDGRTADLPPLSIVFKNYGRTPATLKHWGGSLTIEAAVPKAVLDDRQFTMRVLAPKDEVTSEISSSLTISPEQRKKLENGAPPNMALRLC